jgi:chromosome condensin MukBEF complex kleisin-like MukF subunit
MATAEPLTPPWLRDYQARVDPQLSPIQRLACEAIWAWFNELWEGEQVDSTRLHDLRDEVLPLFEQIETSTGLERDDPITELVERLREIDTSVFFPR